MGWSWQLQVREKEEPKTQGGERKDGSVEQNSFVKLLFRILSASF